MGASPTARCPRKTCPSLFEAGFLDGGAHRLHLGLTEDIPYFKRQERLTFARVGITDPVQPRRLRSSRRLERAEERAAAGAARNRRNRHRVGPARPRRRGVSRRHQMAHRARAPQPTRNTSSATPTKAIRARISDRMIMEGDPFVLIEGMTIAAIAVGATRGYIYLRSEYPARRARAQSGDRGAPRSRISRQRCAGQRQGLSTSRCGAAPAPTSAAKKPRMLESLEGKRGMVRFKPPLPAIEGLFGKPTRDQQRDHARVGARSFSTRAHAYYRDFGMGRSRGTLPFQLAGNIKHGGLVEKAFGLTLARAAVRLRRRLGVAGGRSARCRSAVRSARTCPSRSSIRRSTTRRSPRIGAMIGHGGVVVFDDTVDMARMARYAMEFCAIESCGKCTPCRIGSTRGVEVIDRIIARRAAREQHRPCCAICATP